MAEVSDSVGLPTVTPRIQAPDDYQRISTNPNMFGADAGQGLRDVGSAQVGATIKALDFYNEIAANDATNSLQEQSNKVIYGDPSQQTMGPDGTMQADTGYRGLRGAAAMSARQPTLDKLDQITKQISSGLTPKARIQFENESRRYRFSWEQQIGTHAEEQQRVWENSVRQQTRSVGLNTIGAAPEDDGAYAQGLHTLRGAYVKQAQADGTDINEAITRADQDALVTRIHALTPTNAPMAQRVLDDNRGILAGLPNYDALTQQVKTHVIDSQIGPASTAAVAEAKASAQASVGSPGTPAAKPGFDSAWQFTLSHEGGYSPHDANGQPVNFGINQGAHPDVNVSKLTPETAKPLAKPYWDQIHGDTLPANMQNPAFDTAFIFGPKVANEMVAQAGGDPNQLINIRAQRMQHLIDTDPAKYDKYRESWEKRNNDLRAQVSGSGGGQKYLSTTDAMIANRDGVEDKAEADAQKMFSQYPDAQDRYVSRVMRDYDRSTSKTNQQHVLAVHTVQQALSGAFTQGHTPANEDELMAISPDVATAYRDMQINDSGAAMGVNRIFDANAKGKALGFGKQFNSLLMDRVLAPANDHARVQTSANLWPYVDASRGADAPLTNNGLGVLSGVIGQRGTPQGESQAAQLRAFLQKARKVLSDQDPASGIYDPKGEDRFTHYVMNALPLIQAEEQGGKSMSEILGPKGDLWNSVGTYDRTPQERMRDRIMGHGNASTADQSPQAQQAAMAQGFQRAYASAQTDQQRQEVIEDARRNGFQFRPKQKAPPPNPNAPPEVPRPAQLEQLQKKTKPITQETLETPQSQWAKLQIDDFDYGKLKDTNPLAYLGYMASRGQVSEFKTPLSALGITAEDKGYDKDKGDEADLVRKVMTEAGVDPKSATGHILLGPEFAAGKSTYTLEHELMHRGLMALFERGQTKLEGAPSGELEGRMAASLGYRNQEPLLQLWTLLHGTDGHQNDLAKQPKEYMQEYPQLMKNQKFYDEQLQQIQSMAKRLVGK